MKMSKTEQEILRLLEADARFLAVIYRGSPRCPGRREMAAAMKLVAQGKAVVLDSGGRDDGLTSEYLLIGKKA